jgi:nitrile hydratase accessory protein
VSSAVERLIADDAGAAAPPRRNGELVFDAPWQSRAFGLAVALHDTGSVDYEEFRGRLIEEIAAWEGGHDAADAGWSYYERWLHALERVVVERGIATGDELRRAAHEIAHDHAHDHDHLRADELERGAS